MFDICRLPTNNADLGCHKFYMKFEIRIIVGLDGLLTYVTFLLCKAVTTEATSPMTPKGFSGVTCRSMSVVVVTALVLMDTVATDVGEDDCF